MAKPTKPEITIPQGFAQDGQKADFTQEKLQNGFNPVDPDVLAGDNLNKFIDDTYKGLNYSISGVDSLYTGAVLYEEGIEYNSKSIVFNISEDNTVEVYRSLVDNNINNPLSDVDKWVKVDIGGGSSAGGAIGDLVFKDHVLTYEESKGLALLGTWVYKNPVSGSRYGYPGFYAKCLEEYTNSDNTQTYLASNIELIGTPIDNRGVMSGFSATNYAKAITPSKPDITSFELEVDITTGSDITTAQCPMVCFDETTGKAGALYVQIFKGNFILYLSNNGTSHNLADGIAISPAEVNKHYLVKYTWDGSTFVAYINGEQVKKIENTGNIVLHDNDVTIGGRTRLTNEYFRGSVNLNNSYLKINGEYWWKGVTTGLRNSSGHIFYDISKKDLIDSIYTSTGMAWYYGVDEENERIFLPRNIKYMKFGTPENVGQVQEAGVPNITGRVRWTNASAGGNGSQMSEWSGAFYVETSTSACAGGNNWYTTNTVQKLDASRSSAVYRDTDTVDVDSINLLCYMVVGTTESESAITDVTEITTSENDTLPLYTGKYFDFIPEHISWVKFATMVSGNIYTSAYNNLVNLLTSNSQNLNVIDESAMEDGADYSTYWKINQTNMTITTPLRTSERVLVAKKLPTEADPSWYNWYSDGWCEQGGKIDVPAGSSNQETSKTINLLKPYLDTQYYINTNQVVDSFAGYIRILYVTARTDNQFTIKADSQSSQGGAATYNWVATGYASIPQPSDYAENLFLYFKLSNAVQNLELMDAGEVMEAVNKKLSRDNKAEIIGWGIPDYSAGVVVPSGYVVPKAGIVILNSGTTGSAALAINNTPVLRAQVNSNNAHLLIPTLVGVGDVVTANNIGNGGGIHYYPMKGVSNA